MHALIAAFLGPDSLALLIPIIAVGGPMVMGMVAMMQHHQRKMAQIIHGSNNTEALQGEIDQLRGEVQSLKSTVASQASALDGLAKNNSLQQSNEAASVAQRLG